MSSSAKSICYVETTNALHFLLDLTYTMGMVVVVVVVKTVEVRQATFVHALRASFRLQLSTATNRSAVCVGAFRQTAREIQIVMA